MNLFESLNKLRRETDTRFRKLFEQIPSLLFGWTTIAKSSAMGDGDQVQTGDGQKGQRPARRLEPWGHRGRAPGKVRSFWIRIGGSNVLYVGIAPSKGYGPQNLDEGETALYCSADGTIVTLDKDGNIKITAAAGKDVVVNGGNLKVARDTDTTDNGTLVFNPGSGGATLAFVSPGGALPMPGPGDVNITLSGEINSGADHFKG